MGDEQGAVAKSRLPIIAGIAILVLIVVVVVVRSLFTSSLGEDVHSRSWLMPGYDGARSNYNYAEVIKPPLKQQRVFELKFTSASKEYSTTIFAADEKNIYTLSFPRASKAQEQKNRICAFAAKTGKMRWEFDQLMLGFGTVDENHLYCVSAKPNKVVAIDIASGKKVWESQLTKKSTARQIYTPVVRDGVVYVVSENAELFALDGKTGKKRWTYSATGIVGSPAVSRGVVYCLTQDNRVLALDAKSGEQKWIVGAPTWKALLNPSVGNGQVYVVDRNRREATDTLVTLGAKNGELQWQFPIEKNVIVNSLCVSKGRVFLSLVEFKKAKPKSTSQGRVVAFDSKKGKRIWSKEVWGMPAFLIGAGDTLYISSSRTWRGTAGRLQAEGGSVFAISTKSGKIIEEHKIVTSGLESQSVYMQPPMLISNGSLFAQNVLNNNVHVLGD